MKSTLLDMTQNILSALGSDEVNSISDSTESMQVATIIKNKTMDIYNRGYFPEHFKTFQLDASLDGSTPTIMYVPTGVANIEWLKYFNSNTINQVGGSSYQGNTDLPDPGLAWEATSTSSVVVGLGTKVFVLNDDMLDIEVGDFFNAVSGSNILYGVVNDYTNFDLTVSITTKIGAGTYDSWILNQNVGGFAPPGYEYVTILPVQQFIDHINSFNPTQDDVGSFTFTESYNNIPANFTFYYKNREQPKFCTVLSNYYVIFDAFDVTQDVTLQTSKTLVYGKVLPTFTMEDDYIPDLEDQQFPLLLNEAKALAFFELKQMVHVKAEQEIKRQWSLSQKNKNISGVPTPFDALPNFGRSRRGGKV